MISVFSIINYPPIYVATFHQHMHMAYVKVY